MSKALTGEGELDSRPRRFSLDVLCVERTRGQARRSYDTFPRFRGGTLHNVIADQVTDPVCGMKIRPQDAAGSSEFNGRTIYFCSKGCKQAFDANPGKYAGQSSGTRRG